MDFLGQIKHQLRRGDAKACVEPLQHWLQSATADQAALAEGWLLLATALGRVTDGAEEQLAAAQRAQSLAQEHQDLGLEARASCQLSMANRRLGLGSEAADQALLAVRLARQAADVGAESEALLRASSAPLDAEDYPEAQRLLRESLACAEAVGDPMAMFWPLNNLSHILGVQAAKLAEVGDTAAASARVSELVQVVDRALALSRSTGNRLQEAFALSNLADASIVEGDLPRARMLIQTYGTLAEQIDENRLVIYASLDEVRLLRAQSRPDDAIAVLMAPPLLARLAHEDDLAQVRSELLFKLHRELGRHELALQHHIDWSARQIAALTLRAEKQQRVLLARIDLEQARAAANSARLEAEAQRAFAASMKHERDHHREAARRDPLTGVGNRRAADADLSQRLADALPPNEHQFVAMLDIDHFKRVNDTGGHACGDDVLVALARLLLDRLRGSDRVYRLGGEEFLLLISGTSPSAGTEICERLRVDIQHTDWPPLAAGLALTVSFGVTRVIPGDTTTSLLARADAALYRAKSAGRNRVETS